MLGLVMGFLENFNNKGNGEVIFFCFDRKVYAVMEFDGQVVYGLSLDGFSFKEMKEGVEKINEVWRLMKRKIAIEAEIYKKNLMAGTEMVNGNKLRVEGVVKNKKEVIVFYDYEKEIGVVEVGVVVLDRKDLNRIVWRGLEPVWKSPEEWKEKKVNFAGLISFGGKVITYWKVEGLGILAVSYPEYKVNQKIKIKNSWLMSKENKNPLIAPNEKNGWENFTTFNPAAIYLADKVHILYRAQGTDYQSVLGYAASENGTEIEERLDSPVYLSRMNFEKNLKKKKVIEEFMSGGGCEGCEDPRIVQIDDKVYMTYVAFNGYSHPRIALTSIKLTNFLDKKWMWMQPVLISPPNVVDKSACILPQKINGKYVIFHRIFPNILVDYVDSLDFKPGQYLKGEYKISPRGPVWWDSRKIGVAAPPILTKDGWLLIYQSVDDKNAGHYKVGAMMLKTDEPQVELYRSRYPILEPDRWYENSGFKAGVVYPCGAVVVGEKLFVYYGGADKYVCVATTDLNNFLEKLKEGKDCQFDGTILGVVK